MTRLGMGGLMTVLMAATVSADVLTQGASRERFGEKDFAYFFIEAEDFHDNDPREFGEAFILSSEEDALLQTVNEEFEPDPNAFSSGGDSITNAYEQSLVTNDVGGGHDVQYLINFDTPGDYYMYIRQHSPLGPDLDRNKHDSFYYPIEFGDEPLQNKANGDDYGMLESIEFSGDVAQRGPWLWFAARDFVENSEADPPIDQDPGSFMTYSITEAMIGQDLVLEFDHREAGTMLDAFLFVATDANLPPTNGEGPDGSGFFGPGDAVDMEFGLLNLGVEPMGLPGDFDSSGSLDAADIDELTRQSASGANDASYDLNSDNRVDVADVTVWVKDLYHSWIGDANLDGEFNSSDLVGVLASGTYEANVDAVWSTGDFNSDGQTNSSDLVAALADGGYEMGPRALQAVPEPTGALAVMIAIPIVVAFLRRS